MVVPSLGALTSVSSLSLGRQVMALALPEFANALFAASFEVFYSAGDAQRTAKQIR
jgi:hypothetical protein